MAAIDGNTVSILVAFAGMLAGFFGITKLMLGQAAKDRDADRDERKALTDAIESMSASTKRVAEATVKSASEAKQRNGHLGQQNVEIVKLVTSQNRDISDIKDSNAAIAETLSKSALIAADDKDSLVNMQVKDQHVEHLHIDHTTVNKEN